MPAPRQSLESDSVFLHISSLYSVSASRDVSVKEMRTLQHLPSQLILSILEIEEVRLQWLSSRLVVRIVIWLRQ